MSTMSTNIMSTLSPSPISQDPFPLSTPSLSSNCLTNDEPKESISSPNSDMIYLQKIQENEQMQDWIEKAKSQFEQKMKHCTVIPFMIERIVQCCVVRNRTAEIFPAIERYIQRYKRYELNTISDKTLINEEELTESWPIYIYGHGKQGHPVFYDEIACTDYSHLFKKFVSSVVDHNKNKNKNNDVRTTHNKLIINPENNESEEIKENDNINLNKEEEEQQDADADDDTDDDDEEEQKLEQTTEEQALDLLTNFRFKFYVNLAHHKKQLSKKYNITIFRHILILDLKDFSYSKIASNISNFIKMAKPVIQMEQSTFPETAYKTYLINCPWSFRFVWKIMSAWFDPIIKEKIKMLGNNYLNELLKEIDIGEIPVKYGGTGSWDIICGGTTPIYNKYEEEQQSESNQSESNQSESNQSESMQYDNIIDLATDESVIDDQT